MKITVQISKTWQEKQYEPFNITLGQEVEIDGYPNNPIHKMQDIARDLQQTAQEIYDERRSR
jgi:hypothetical protein